MALEPSLPPIPDDAEEPAKSGRGFASILLVALVLLPVVLLSGALAWLWNESAHRSGSAITGATVADAPAAAAAARQRVSEVDQGIEFSASLEGSVYPLKEMSTGKPITEDGEPVYVTADGTRVRFPVLWQDNFTNPNSGWDGRLVGGYAQGEYRLLLVRDGAGSDYARHTQQFGDFMVRTDARLDRPTTGVYLYLGFRLREGAQGAEGYALVVTPDDQTFRLELWQQEGGSQRTVRLIGDTPSPAIQPGTAWNRLVVRAQGAEINLFINGQQVGKVNDETSLMGTLALGVGKRQDALALANADARFASLVVSGVSR
jgi:hypothetical protein